ncbi:MAG TPA: hypothetical protein DCL54_09610 [Alphaproteobacteria bacterium]|nr:hypothetical protein [Alphaproteobacteria bacterium]
MRKELGIGLALSACALVLSACGFRPLYATESTPAGVATYFGQIYVEEMTGRTGLVLRNQLMDAFTPLGTPGASAFRLTVKLEEKREGLAIQENTEITRYNYTLIARFELRDSQTEQVLNTGTSRAIAGYNVVNSQFATQTALRDAEERAARELGEDIRLRLGIYFERRYGVTDRPA